MGLPFHHCSYTCILCFMCMGCMFHYAYYLRTGLYEMWPPGWPHTHNMSYKTYYVYGAAFEMSGGTSVPKNLGKNQSWREHFPPGALPRADRDSSLRGSHNLLGAHVHIIHVQWLSNGVGGGRRRFGRNCTNLYVAAK